MTIFIHAGRYICFSENVHIKFLIKFCIKLYVSEQLFAPIMIVYILRLHKHNISI